jgi:hypothetical protein
MEINMSIYHNLHIILMFPQVVRHIHRLLTLMIKYLKIFIMNLGLNFIT